MFLKTLTLKGFKSFADTTAMELEPGVTVVVGPNGSGKSNVVDAVAWVLGAQAPSAVRSQKMEDVIFNGTSKKSALGRAEVLLTLDNSSGVLPLEFTEITIGRTLFRNGDSEYSINGVECRLLDVQELLSDAGVGRQQHVIISQGQIDAVLNARAEDRRAIIEEAAGVLKYRKRKERAERRLESTEANLLRVQDLIREVRRQLRPLERQAEAARRHGEIVAELRALKLFLAGRELASLRTRLETLAREKVGGEDTERALRAQLAELDTVVMTAEAELSARGDSGVSDELVKVEQLRERARGLAAVIAERQRSMERDRGALMAEDVVASLEADAARFKAELAEVETGLATATAESNELVQEENVFAAERGQTEALLEGGPSTTSASAAAAEVRGELRTLRNTVELGAGEVQRLQTRIEQIEDQDARLVTEIDRLQSELTEVENALFDAKARLTSSETRRAEAEVAGDDAQRLRAEAETVWSRWNARLEALQAAMATSRARMGAEHLASVDGVVGALIDLVTIDDGFDAAVKAALGEALSAVVVNDANVGRRALTALRTAGRVGAILALDHVPSTGVGIPSGSQSLRSHVHTVPTAPVGLSGLLDSLLSRVGYVDSLDDAITVAMTQPAAIVVTRAGDRLTSNGWRIGAADELGAKEAVDEASTSTAQAAEELDRRTRALDVARNELLAARSAVAEANSSVQRCDGSVDAASDALTKAVNDRRALTTERHISGDALNDTRSRMLQHLERVAELEAILPGLEESEAAELAAAQAYGETRASIDARATHLGLRRKDLDVRIAGLREREQFLRERSEDLERRLAADATARAEAGERRRNVERSLTAIVRLAALVEAHRAVTETRLAELHDIRRRQSDEVRQLAQKLDEARRTRHTVERELEARREQSRRIEVEETEVRIRLEGAVESVRRELEVEPEVAEAAPLPEVADGSSPTDRARMLERDLRLMGPINPLALEEFTELQKRHEFLEEQLTDVRNTRRELMQIIKAIDEEIQTVFASAFADVSKNFTELFAMLFPGGKGRLILTTPNDLLNTGIEVEAAPPGKNIKKLSLLSGGERSLTALAYLFAVFRSRPSPFYVMDEVEAALDDVNLHRFLGLVAEFRRTAQLIIVSHQKRTMEAADVLFGVSMQPGGSSKVVVEHAPSSIA